MLALVSHSARHRYARIEFQTETLPARMRRGIELPEKEIKAAKVRDSIIMVMAAASAEFENDDAKTAGADDAPGWLTTTSRRPRYRRAPRGDQDSPHWKQTEQCGH
jgi:hypothetical protein